MTTIPASRPDRRVFLPLALLALCVGVAGFAPTWLLGHWFRAPPLTPLVHFHAVLFTAWLVILIAQSVLIRANRYRAHARLGKSALAIAALMVLTGFMVVLGKPRLTEGSRAFIFTPLLSLLLFPVLVATAIRLRHDMATHKRLMWLATLLFMGAPFTRLMNMAGLQGGPYVHHAAMYLLLLMPLVAYDLWRYRRLHSATLWGGLILVLRHPLHELVAFTPQWQELAARITAPPG